MTIVSIIHRRVAPVIFLLFLLCLGAVAQERRGSTITGRVFDDATKEWLATASVRLLTPSDSTLIKGAFTDQQGTFRFTGITDKSVLVEVSFVGYETFSKQLTPKQGETMDLGTITLSPSATALAEVEVVAQANPVTMKTDTVQFNAGAFRVQTGATVEDLLRRIPGIEVDEEGNISYNGEAIEQVELDGRNFFSGDPTMATQNLPASMIQNIQVVDKKSEQARLTGMDDGDKVKVLNLNVKQEMKEGAIANLNAGYGTHDRYSGRLMGIYFRDNSRFTLMGDLNNLAGVRRGRGDQTMRSLGGNYDSRFGNKLNMTAEAFYRDMKSSLPSTIHTENLLGSGTASTIEDETSLSNNRSRHFNFGGRLEWTPTEQTALFFMPNVDIGKTDSYAASDFGTVSSDGTAINEGESETINDSDTKTIGGTLHLRHTFNDAGRNLYIRLFGNHSTQDGLGTITSTTDFLKEGRREVIDQQTTSALDDNSGGFSLSYLEPFSRRWALQLNYRLSAQSRDNSRLAYNADADGTYTLLDKTYSRGSQNSNLNQEIGFRIRYSFGDKSKALLGFNALPTHTHTITTDGEEVTYDQERSIVNYSPTLMLDLRPSDRFQMMLHYMGHTDQPSMDQLNPVVIQSSPLSRTMGNPDLLPSFRHMVFTRAFYNNPETKRSFELFGNFDAVNNSVINRREIDRETGMSETTYENVNGILSARLGGGLTLPFAKEWTSYTFGRLSYNRNKAFVNGELNSSTSFRPSLSQRITWSGEYVQATLGGEGTYNRVRNSISEQNNRETLDYTLFNEFTWDAPFGLSLTNRISYNNAAGYNDEVKRELCIWDITLGYSFLRDKSATISLEAKDLLAQRNTFRRSISAQSITDTLYEGVTSYVMLTFTYKLNTLGRDAAMDGPGRHRGPGMRLPRPRRPR